ncbi:MAG: hypothetical protein AAFO94_22385, partial [Bacteroidota bacterium]
MTFLVKELKEAYENVQRRKKMQIHFKHLEKLMSDKRREIGRLGGVMDAEQQDVERLQKKKLSDSLVSLFVEVLDNKEAQLEAERQEYLQAFLQWEAAKKELELLRYEKEVLKEQFNKLRNSKTTLKKLLRDRENYLRKTNGVTAEAILENDKRIYVLTEKKRELSEAIQAGEALYKTFFSLHKELEQVQNWGDFVMGGKGRYSSYKKKKYIERNRAEINTINHQVLQYATE